MPIHLVKNKQQGVEGNINKSKNGRKRAIDMGEWDARFVGRP